MIRKLLAVGMAAVLAAGGLAQGGDYDLPDPTVPVNLDLDNAGLSVGILTTGTAEQTVSLGKWDIGDQQLVIGDDSFLGGTGAGKVVVSYDTLTIDDGELGVTRLGTVNIGNAVADAMHFAGGGGSLLYLNGDGVKTSATYGGIVNFATSAYFDGDGALYSDTGGTVTGKLYFTDEGALSFDLAGDATLNLDDVVIDTGDTSFLDNTFNVVLNGFTATLNLNSLNVASGFLGVGNAGTVYTVLGAASVGGDLDTTDANAPFYRKGDLAIRNGGKTNFESGLTILPGGEVYAGGNNKGAGAPPVANVGTPEQTGNVVLRGTDAVNRVIWDNTKPTAEAGFMAELTVNNSKEYPADAEILRFFDVNGSSKLQLLGTEDNLRGVIYFGSNADGWMDMEVDLTSDAASGGIRQNMINGTSGNAGWDNFAKYNSLTALGGKFSGYSTIGDIEPEDDGWDTEVHVGAYSQTRGILHGVVGTDLTGAPFSADLWVHEATKVTGGMMAVDTRASDDLSFGNNSIEYVDRAVLGAVGQTISNVTDDASNGNGAAYRALTLRVGKNGVIALGSRDIDNRSRAVNGDLFNHYNNANLDFAFASLDIRDIDTVVDFDGDIDFEKDIILAATAADRSANITVKNSGSVKFTENALLDWRTTLAVGDTDVLVSEDAGNRGTVTIDIADVEFDGLYGAFFATHNAVDNTYGITRMADTDVTFDGSVDDFDRANAKLNAMYGHKTSGGMNQMIYQSVSQATSPTADYQRLYLKVGATADEIDSFNMNFENLQHFAKGRSEAGPVLNLYNGNAMNGVNMVAQAVARSHIRTAMNRSDEIRETYHLARNAVEGSDALAASIMNACYANRFWAGGFGLWEDADSRHGLAGYKYKSGGFVVGYDRLIGSNFIVGGSFAYNKGDFEDKAALSHDSDIDNYSFNLYGTYTHCSGFFGTVFAGYTYSDNDISEGYLTDLNKYARSNADNHTNTWVLGGKVGYDWKPAERLYITPSVGFTYINARTSAHDMMLGKNLMGRFGKLKDHAAYIPVEVNIGYDAWVCNDQKLNLNLNVGYAYNFDEDGISGNLALAGFENGIPYSVSSREQGHHLFNVGAGATYSKGRFDVGVKYDYYRQADADTHRVLGTVGLKF